MSTPIKLDPKERFRRSLKRPEEFQAIVSQPMIQDACQDVLSHMALHGYHGDQLNGAIAFVHLFLNFSEEEEKPKPLPVRKLNIQ